MSSISTPDYGLMAQQEKDLRHAGKSQPKQAKKLEGETAAEKVETDLISNERVGAAAWLGRRKSETEQALERARGTAREQECLGRRGRSR